jgi:class 3 adenylate cyclase/predicted ATPase
VELPLLGAEDHRMDVAAWLQGLGLERYVPTFRDNDVDAEVLLRLTAEDLRELGVASIGHRRRLLDAIAALTEVVPRPTTMPAATVTTATPDAPAPADAERRQLTVMFCDLVGSTSLSTRFDPEDLREVIGAYHRCVADTVGRFDGFVAKYMGDGVLVYFGYPRAHEDDAERAVRAGLGVIDAVARLDVKSTRLKARVGIATGLVVVGDLIGEGSAQERGVVGETPNLAARLQVFAEPGTVVIAESTRRQVGSLFDLADLAVQQLAGFTEPQPAWRVLGESGVVSRFEALRSGETPLVGRDEEVDLLLRRWDQVKGGEGRVVLVSGEPGIGKSRLTAALSEHIASEPHTRLRYFCSPHHEDSALYPFIVQLERAAGFARDDTVEGKLAKLTALIAPGIRGSDDIALIAELLSLPNSGVELKFSPQRKREMLFEALLGQLEAVARDRPVLMVFEDTHWIDPTSRELLDLTLDRVGRLPVLLVVTFRPEVRQGWGGQAHVTMLALNRLGGREGAALVQNLAGNVALDAQIVAEIVDRTDGVPLFVEELTKAVLESADQENRVGAVLAASPAATLAIPATLHASLIARLDRLGTAAKEVAQIGAVLGREFNYELIEPVAQQPAAELRDGLDRLSGAGLLFCRGVPPHASYLFKHALVQDAAYGTLLRGRRQELHGRVAAVLERDLADVVERQPELLAHHLTEAGDIIRAVEYWHRAGERATQRSADREAIAHLRTALRLVQQLADPVERSAWELRASIALGPALVNIMTPAAPEVARVYARSRQLAQETGRSVELFQALWGSWQGGLSAGHLGNASALIDELFVLAREQGSEELVLQAHHASWTTSFVKGDLQAALHSIEAGVPLYRRDAYQHHALLYGGHDPGVCGHSLAGMIGALCGKLDRALFDANEAVTLARGLSHRGSLAHAYWLACEAHYLRRDAVAVCGLAAEMLSLAADVGGPLTIMNATIFRGWALVASGRGDEGIVDLRKGLSDWRRIGSKYHGPYRLARVADGLLLTGDIYGTLELLAEAVAVAEQTGEHWSDAELDRLAGTAKLRKSTPFFDPQKAEQHLRRAVDGARENGIRLIELRAATSLARLWGEHGKRAEARELLTPVYGWFTEGFGTPDLKEARALLNELGVSC